MSARFSTIPLRVRDLQIEEAEVNAEVKPGMQIQLGSAGTVGPSNGNEPLELAIAIENALAGMTTDPLHSYTVTDAARAYPYSWCKMAQFIYPQRGDVIAAYIAANCAAITKGQALVSDGAGGFKPPAATDGISTKLYVNTAASAEHENTTDEALFDKSYTLPANFLMVGDIIRVKAQCYVVDNNSTDTLTVTLRIGGLTGTAVVSTGAVDVADGDIAYIEADLIVRTIGANGTFVATGVQSLGVPGTVTAKPFLLGSTAIDTTASQVIGVSADWSAAHADNEVRLDVLEISLLRAGSKPLLVALETYDNSAIAASALVKARCL